jgi:hypothetical protein
MLLRLKRINNLINIDLKTPAITIVRKAIRVLNTLKIGISGKIKK